jgi:hypothetical protein
LFAAAARSRQLLYLPKLLRFRRRRRRHPVQNWVEEIIASLSPAAAAAAAAAVMHCVLFVRFVTFSAQLYAVHSKPHGWWRNNPNFKS